MYDLVGDIHGCRDTLADLLNRLGYLPVEGIFRHPEGRRVIFLGDFIDRGPDQRGVIELVRPMIDAGAALSVMGNHEFNAIAFATPDPAGGYYRAHSEKNLNQHQAFLDAYPRGSDDYQDVIEWFRSLPLWLEIDGLRVVHACWDQRLIDRIAGFQSGSSLLGEALLAAGSREGSWQFEALETLLKGKEIPLTDGTSFADKDGHVRHHIRIRWWDASATTYRDAFLGPESALTHIPDDEIEGDHLIEYRHDAPPLFLGHYWRSGAPEPLSSNIACLDYSVGKPGGQLVAYRWNGETDLSPSAFTSVQRLEP